MDVVQALLTAPEPHTTEGLTNAVARLVRVGDLPPGTKLPTVRDVAAALHMSPTAVSGAWTTLTRRGVLRTEGRRGTFVMDHPYEPAAPRLWKASLDVGDYALDLGTGVPDTDLLPDLGAVLAHLSTTATVSNYLEPSVLPRLQRVLAERWSPVFTPTAIAMVDGALDALDRTCRELVGHGDRVLVEDPSLPTIFDVVEDHGGVPVGVPLDEEGMVPSAVAAALREHRPRLVIVQPRAHNPTGVSMTASRAAELAALLEGTDAFVFEDDHSGDVSWAPLVSMARWRPSHTIVTQSFSKSHGPDLRLAAVAGPVSVIHQLSVRRRLGPSWSSRLLQAVLLGLLEDPASVAAVGRARVVYHHRRQRLVEALAHRGVPTTGTDGINVWLRVADEEAARRRLAKAGIGVRPGSPFELRPSGAHHVRVTCAAVAQDVEAIADQLAAAALPGRGAPPARGVA